MVASFTIDIIIKPVMIDMQRVIQFVSFIVQTEVLKLFDFSTSRIRIATLISVCCKVVCSFRHKALVPTVNAVDVILPK